MRKTGVALFTILLMISCVTSRQARTIEPSAFLGESAALLEKALLILVSTVLLYRGPQLVDTFTFRGNGLDDRGIMQEHECPPGPYLPQGVFEAHRLLHAFGDHGLDGRFPERPEHVPAEASRKALDPRPPPL